MTQTAASPSRARLDLVGTCVSLVCALHCLSVPFLVTVLPLAGAGVLLGGWLEVLFIVASVTLAAGSLCWGFRRHRRWRVFIVLGAALSMIAVGRLLASEAYELLCVVMGAVVLVGGHLLNRYLCLTCRVCEDENARGRSSSHRQDDRAPAGLWAAHCARTGGCRDPFRGILVLPRS